VTEADWQACRDPKKMLAYLEKCGRTSARKLRLYLCACSRNNWPSLEDKCSRKVVEIGERFADAMAGLRELRLAWRAARAAAVERNSPGTSR
jgi:hypothetical protein